MNEKMCEYCMYYEYDELSGGYECVMDMGELDQDEREAMYYSPDKPCPFYRMGDEYRIVRKQN